VIYFDWMEGEYESEGRSWFSRGVITMSCY
jgi:hypothetical protein